MAVAQWTKSELPHRGRVGDALPTAANADAVSQVHAITRKQRCTGRACYGIVLDGESVVVVCGAKVHERPESWKRTQERRLVLSSVALLTYTQADRDVS